MLVFPSSMHPEALLQNRGKPFAFTCDICGESGDGVLVTPDSPGREDWAVLPEEWAEFEDRRPTAPKQFVICCQDNDCQHTARNHAD